MTLAEGLRAILESGVLSEPDTGVETCEMSVEGARTGDCRSTQAGPGDDWGVTRRVQALEYFSSQAGVWQPVRSESDW